MRIQNLPRRKRTFWQSLRIKATKIILESSVRIENPKLKFLQSLKNHAEYSLSPRDYELIACSSDLEVDLDQVGFSDLFFTEDFPKLQKGLNKLLSNVDNQDRLNEWFSEIYNSGSGGAKSIYLDRISFKTQSNDKSIKCLQSANIHLNYIAPSFIVLSILVKPSNKFIQKFIELIKSVPCPQSEILGFSFKYGVASLSTIPAWRVRTAELEELFLEINRSIVLIFRKKFGVGLSCFGYLPCLEIIKTNISLREIPENQPSLKTSNQFRACYNFFESLGYPLKYNPIYRNSNWWNFYEVNRDELFYPSSHNYQILISSADYDKSQDATHKDYYESPSQAIRYTLHHLLSLLALEHFYEILENLIIDLKTDLEPHLSGQIQGIITLRGLKKAISKMIKVNGFYFQHSRIWTGINENLFWNYVCEEAATMSRKKYHDHDSGLLTDDINSRIDRVRKFCEQQLDILKLSYEQILNYKTTTINYKLQKQTFWLSIVVTLLTIVTLIPEEIRNQLITDIWFSLNSMFY
ncbi:hypothetical protein [Nodularia sp. NIES-3585]|uniref:hypothetical protein n=1 Tax=Nodularia sp. NIES-3585 TaxID=1973477 RepID=UPI000B5CA2DA|nr:hypothetical protein [Nodularia sp. NIES-3585]GAX38239.1 hypothetical protein NIES3585_42870 [Nodularia sp. NIES-3585]